MSKLDALVERALIASASRLGQRGVAVLAVALYGGVGLALPLTLGLSTEWLVVLNMVGASWAGCILLVWVAVEVRASQHRLLIEWTTNLRLLTAEEFEWLVGEVFRREGWQVEETGRQDAPDGNIDLRLKRDGRHAIVQCKRWESRQVPVDEIRKFGGTLMREALPADAGIFVTLSDFNEQARVEAKQTGITLIDGHELYERIEKVKRPEPCPTCASPMQFARSDYGWWFRCIAPGCMGKRDLGSDAARAVDLLTSPPG